MFDQAIAEQITGRLSAGEPMAQICRSENMPCVTTVWTWQQQNPSFAESIARAREQGFDMIAADCLRIADEVPAVSDEVQRARLRVESRLKLLAKWDPKRYGDRSAVELTGANGSVLFPVTAITVVGVSVAQLPALEHAPCAADALPAIAHDDPAAVVAD